MITNECKNGLKGQHIRAQGKRSVALGFRMDRRIVRALTLFKVISLLRTKSQEFLQKPENNEMRFRPEGISCPNYHVHADGFLIVLYKPGVAWGQNKLAFQAET